MKFKGFVISEDSIGYWCKNTNHTTPALNMTRSFISERKSEHVKQN